MLVRPSAIIASIKMMRDNGSKMDIAEIISASDETKWSLVRYLMKRRVSKLALRSTD